MDLSKIAESRPRVNKVDLISGKQFRKRAYRIKAIEPMGRIRVLNKLLKLFRYLNDIEFTN